MVRVIRATSNKVWITGGLGLLAVGLLIGAVFVITSGQAKALMNPLLQCTRNYGMSYNTQWTGGGQHPTWDDPAYDYKVWGFQVIADGGVSENQIIDSYDVDCNGGYPNDDVVSSPDTVTPEQLMFNGEKPVAATLGVPAFNSNNNGTWAQDTVGEIPPDPAVSPPVYQRSHGRYAAHVDDSGMAFINDQMIWCIAIVPGPGETSSPAPSPNGCSPDITTTQTRAGAGHLFVDTNCPSGLIGGCGNGNNFNWYRQYNNNTPELTNRIGVTNGVLNSFKLRMLAGQTYQGGNVAFMVMTFKYPKAAAQCVSITAPDTVTQGQTFNATVSIKNNGSTTWNAGGANPYRMGASDPRDTPKWGPISPGGFTNRALLTANVAPGATATVTFSAVATGIPATGDIAFSWEILQEGIRWVGGKCMKVIRINPSGAPPLLHKIYAANIIELSQQQVRDNETFVATLKAYIWPDAGRRALAFDRTNRLWLAGIYGEQGYLSGDNANSDNSKRANPNAMTSFNTRAEASCPGSNCLERVPMAYVPANDGAGVPSTATLDGSTTPNGNKWQPIKDRIFGSYSARLGGIASTDNGDVDGHTGNYIHNVEITNIRVDAIGPTANAAAVSSQGGVTAVTLQPDDTTQSANLPGGSQGPIQNGQPFNAWDNIRRPGAPGGLAVTSTQGSVSYTNAGNPTSPANFTHNPEQLLSLFSSTVTSRAQTFSTVNITSLLQDGNDRDHSVPYSNLTEPLSYTAGIGSISNVRLKWDEYVDWSQVDDKGHYYTTKANRPTGVSQGAGNGESYSLESFDRGSSQFSHVDHSATHTHESASLCGRNPNGTAKTCAHHHHYMDVDVYTQCTGSYSYRTGINYTNNSQTYYSPSIQSQSGWYNSNTTTQSMPYGSNGQTAQSAFYPTTSSNPAWATVGTGNPLNPFYYQDTSVTSLNNSGSTNRNGSSYSPNWRLDRSDPAYTNRYIFQNTNTPSFPVDWNYTYSSSCKYPNGSGAYVSSNGTTQPIYRNAQLLYENSGNGTGGTIHGTYGNGATHDGASDGQVDVGWDWASNRRRVRYESTYNGNYRNLGPRTTDGTGGPDGTLYGIEGYPSIAKLARASATIGSPIIGTASGDIFSAGGLSSYFRNSSAASAFIFTNSGNITNFLGASGYFPNYYINPDSSRVNSVTLPGNPDSIHKIFASFDTEVVGKSQPIGTSMSGNFNLAGSTNRIYRVPGNLTMGATTFCGGPGTIYVEGDLTITGNTSYCAYNGTDRTQLPSAGIIVRGNVYVNPGVSNVVGSFFANGTFSTGTVLDPAGNNRTTRGDVPFTLNGLVVAHNFALQRQPSGTDNINAPVSGITAERFLYDGRVVVATPPAFNNINTAPAVWNEAAPSN